MPPIETESTKDKPRAFKVQLTGFGPFDVHATNPSWEIAKQLDSTTIDSQPGSITTTTTTTSSQVDSTSTSTSSKRRKIELVSNLIPVTYTSSLSIVPSLHHQDHSDVDLFLHIGVGLPQSLTLETNARKVGYLGPGVDGLYAPLNSQTGERGFVDEEWKEIDPKLNSSIDLDTVLNWVRVRGGVDRLRKSDDAGLYLCEFTYYCSMACSEKRARSSEESTSVEASTQATDSVPKKRRRIPVQFVHVPPVGMPYSLPELTQALRLILWAIVNEGGLEGIES